MLAAATEPRRVEAGAETLELGGRESPAVVNLVASDWRLGREALPATLLDLAARKLVAVEQVGERTFVRVRSTGDSSGGATDYEEMVLGHVRGLAAETDDGMVPAEALTTGPEEDSAGWWRRYRKAVQAEAREQGLSRARWSTTVHTVLIVGAVVVSAGLALAALTGVHELEEWSDDQETASTSTTATTTEDEDDESPIGAVVMVGIVSWGGLISIVEAVGRRERDTPAGREAAARWLGLREMLVENPLFAEQPPAGVAVWDRHLAYGAALGVAHGAVRALPLGAESDHTAWSSVGGRWRVVRIRYPRRIPPGYGRHPFRAFSVGLLQSLAALAVLRIVPDFLLNDFIDELRAQDPDLATDSAELGARITAIVIGTAAAAVLVRAAWMCCFGFLDLVSGRRDLEGKVLRFRYKGSDKYPGWYMAVDTGETPRIRAWLFHERQSRNQGETVRARVTKRLQHVRLETERAQSRTDEHEMNAPGE